MSDTQISDEPFDSNSACDKISRMWRDLGDRISGAIPDIMSDCGPEKAIQWGRCAEVCYWQATGECSSSEMKDVLPAPPVSRGE